VLLIKLRSLKDNVRGLVDLGIILMIGIAFAGLTRKARVFRGLDGDSLTDNVRMLFGRISSIP